jgi:hypothetical protein
MNFHSYLPFLPGQLWWACLYAKASRLIILDRLKASIANEINSNL